MANPTSPTRLSPAELRRRLLGPPTDAPATSIVPEDAPAAPSHRVSQRREGRSSIATQAVIDLDMLSLDQILPPTSKQTPLPDGRLDATQFRSQPEQIPTAQPVGLSHSGGAGEDANALRAQIGEMTRIIEEMKPVLEEASNQEGRFQAREQEIQAQLTAKDQEMEELQVKIQLLEEQIAIPKVPKTRDELEEWSDELEKENSKLTQDRKRIEDDRKQLREDEESLERQMREMECSMARERAMMARQETELKRLSAEIQHELELLQRGDSTLREQLSKFQRRHQEVLSRALGPTPPPMAEPVTATAMAQPAKKDSGLLRRIFRGGK